MYFFNSFTLVVIYKLINHTTKYISYICFHDLAN